MKMRIISILAACIITVLFSGCNTEETAEPKVMRKALFLYTGEEYFVGDYVLSGNVTVFNESGLSEEIYYDDFRKVPDESFDVNYWFKYGGMEYPAIELLWDADKVAQFSVDIYSIDGAQNLSFNENGYFYRYDESSNEDSERIYYFEETVNVVASKTDITQNEYITDAKRYDNPIIECGEGEAAAYLMYFDASEDHYYRYDGKPCTLRAENTVVTGEGDYVVSLTAESPVADVRLAALCVELGEEKFPEYTYFITAMTIDGVPCLSTKPYTVPMADGASWTYIYGMGIEDIDENARCPGGEIDECSNLIIPEKMLEGWTELKVYFTVIKPGGHFDSEAKTQEIYSQITKDTAS